MENTSFAQRRRNPSFSSSLLDSIYRSIDEGVDDTITISPLRNYSETVTVKEQSIREEQKQKASSLGRGIMIEDWMEKKKERSKESSDSSDSSSSAMFSSSEESNFGGKLRKSAPPVMMPKTGEKQREGNFKLKAMKFYGELKNLKQPISPSGRISSFLNSIINGNGKKMCSAA